MANSIPRAPTSTGAAELIDPQWNISALRIYLDTRLDALNELKSHDLIALHNRIDAHEHVVEKRFELARDFNAVHSKAATDALAVAMTASRDAISKSEQSVEKRFDSVNEFRQSLNDLQGRLIQRTEVETMVKANGDKITELSSRMDRATGQQTGTETSWSTVMILGGMILTAGISIVSLVSRPNPDTSPPYASTQAALAVQNSRVEGLAARLNAIPPHPSDPR